MKEPSIRKLSFGNLHVYGNVNVRYGAVSDEMWNRLERMYPALENKLNHEYQHPVNPMYQDYIPSGEETIELSLLELTGSMHDMELRLRLERMKYRPAVHEELIAFVLECECPDRCTVTALGSTNERLTGAHLTMHCHVLPWTRLTAPGFMRQQHDCRNLFYQSVDIGGVWRDHEDYRFLVTPLKER